ncbi:hypothetical protein CDV55_102092 [Aspergillus turcosus]|nr:hypothetical protein CDV55_102092 [Aspergillus turcosus]
MGSNRQMVLIEQARQAATFDPIKLTHIIYDGYVDAILYLGCHSLIYGREENVSSRRAAFQRVESALELTDNMKLPHIYTGLDRNGLYLEGVRRGRAIIDDMILYKHNQFENLTERYQLTNSTPFGLSFLMFRRTIDLQGTLEQKQHWLPLIDQMKVNGCYLQTELGHGSHVRGIETTATFDPDTGEFVVHSPTLTATKYWPGGLGLSCSHAVVAAKLRIRDKDHGMHWFVVQIRSLNDFAPVPGIELGDVGMKMAYNGTCNGYARFDHVRMPHSSLLAAHAQVLPDGSYVRPEDNGQQFSKQVYSTMLQVRQVIIQWAAFGLAQPLTVAARYSVVREQGVPMFSDPRAPEVAIVAYKSQHYRLLTLISQAYAILFACKEFDDKFSDFQREKSQGNLGRLPFIHALSTALKAWTTNTAAVGAEEARKMCGGQGYVALSGLPEMVATACVTATFEGENYVMWQQLMRYLFKQIDVMRAGGRVDSDMVECLREFKRYLQSDAECSLRKTITANHIFTPSTLRSIFQNHYHRLLASAYTAYTRKRQVSSAAEAWNSCLMRLLPAAHAYAEYIVLQSMQRRVEMIQESEPSLFPVLSRLSELFALTTITGSVSSFHVIPFAEDGVLTSDQFDAMRMRIDEILSQLLPDLIALTDAWDFTDASLNSALGCRDGNVYERLMSWTRQLPVNTQDLAKHAWEMPGGIQDFLKRERQMPKAML